MRRFRSNTGFWRSSAGGITISEHAVDTGFGEIDLVMKDSVGVIDRVIVDEVLEVGAYQEEMSRIWLRGLHARES